MRQSRSWHGSHVTKPERHDVRSPHRRASPVPSRILNRLRWLRRSTTNDGAEFSKSPPTVFEVGEPACTGDECHDDYHDALCVNSPAILLEAPPGDHWDDVIRHKEQLSRTTKRRSATRSTFVSDDLSTSPSGYPSLASSPLEAPWCEKHPHAPPEVAAPATSTAAPRKKHASVSFDDLDKETEYVRRGRNWSVLSDFSQHSDYADEPASCHRRVSITSRLSDLNIQPSRGPTDDKSTLACTCHLGEIRTKCRKRRRRSRRHRRFASQSQASETSGYTTELSVFSDEENKSPSKTQKVTQVFKEGLRYLMSGMGILDETTVAPPDPKAKNLYISARRYRSRTLSV